MNINKKIAVIGGTGKSGKFLVKELGIKRYVLVSGINVDADGDRKGTAAKAATEWMYANYHDSTVDKQQEYDMLKVSNLDWTMVRSTLIILDDENKPINVLLEDCPGDQISATSLANFLIDQLTKTSVIKEAPFIANK